MSQPNPVMGYENVSPIIVAHRFSRLLEQRVQKGIATYGTILQTFNGRDALLDLAKELVDAWQYLVQVQMEHEAIRSCCTDLLSAIKVNEPRMIQAEAAKLERFLFTPHAEKRDA